LVLQWKLVEVEQPICLGFTLHCLCKSGCATSQSVVSNGRGIKWTSRFWDLKVRFNYQYAVWTSMTYP
jgi:hypothetical protein